MRQPDRYAAAAVLCFAALLARFVVGAHITDDAYITMRYSRNLSASGAMSYNPPDAVLGTSTPLWTWILAAGDAVGVAPDAAAVVAASLADMCSIVLILASPVGGTLAATGAAATIAAWPAYVMYAVSGMETSLYVLTIVGFVCAMSRRQFGIAALAASLAFLCRPDGGLLVALGFGWLAVAEHRTAAFRFACTTAVICGPWIIYAFARFGSAIPASVAAKAAAADPWFLSLQNLQAFFLSGIYLPVTLLALAGFTISARSGDALWRLWSLWACCYLACMTAANAFTHFPWYYVPLLPILTGAALIAFEEAARAAGWQLLPEVGGTPEGSLKIVLPSAVARGAVAAALAALLLSRMPSLKSYLDETAAGRETLYASVATELAGIDARCTVAATEIGTIGYHYPGRVLDLVGLVSPEVVGRPIESVLAESRARWVVTYDTHFSRSIADSAQFSALFHRRSTFPVAQSRMLEIYERRDRSGCAMP